MSETKTLRFWGASDDLFEIESTKRGDGDEIGCFDKPMAVRVRSADRAHGLIVTAVYASIFQGRADLDVPACWSIGVMPMDEDVPLPTWPMRWRATGYTTELEIDVPADALIEDLREGDR